jgi:hypothetical protein
MLTRRGRQKSLRQQPRRRDPDANKEIWLIHCDDIRLAASYSASHRRLPERIGRSFDAARAAFDAPWQWLHHH